MADTLHVDESSTVGVQRDVDKSTSQTGKLQVPAEPVDTVGHVRVIQ